MNSKIKKLIALLIVIVIAILPISAFAEDIYVAFFTTYSTADVELLQDGSFDESIVDNLEYGSTAEFGTSNVETFIYNQLLSCVSTIKVYTNGYRLNVSDFGAVYSNAINDNPDLFYVSSSCSYNYTSSGYVYSITPQYTMTSTDDINNAKKIFNAGVSKALAQVNISMTDVQKALVIHDYMCDIATYPSDATSNDKAIYHSAYGIFYDGKTVCAGYTLAYTYLLKQLGIESEYVVSNALNHAWNKIKINDNWYNVDLTYDDISFYNSKMNIYGGCMHRCFLKSDAAIKDDIGFYHYDIVTADDCTANDTTYDDYFWNDINTNIIVLNGDYYYVDLDGSAIYFFKKDSAGNITKLSDSLPYSKGTLSGTYSDESGTSHSVSFSDYRNRLVYMDNKFYISASYYLYSFANLNGRWQKYTINKADYAILGVGVTDDNQITYQTMTDYKTTTLNKEDYFKNNITLSGKTGYNNYVDFNNDNYVNAKDYVILKNN